MRPMHIVACVVAGLLLMPAVAAAQQTPTPSASRVVDRTDVRGGVAPSRLHQTTNETADRKTVTEVEEEANTDGRVVPVRETVVDVIRAGRVVRTTSSRFAHEPSGERRLRETRESTEDGSTDGRVRRTDTTRRTDLEGKLEVAEHSTEHTSVTADGRQTERTTYRPDLDGRLQQRDRTEHTERRVGPQVVQATTTESQADGANRWQVVEIRHRDVRTAGTTEETEETVERPDVNGRVSERERHVSRLTREQGQQHLVIETFTDEGGRYENRPGARRMVTQRISRTTAPRADGGREIVEEVHERSVIAVDDPLRLVRRVVETVGPGSGGRWYVKRQVFERDLNHRLVPTITETGETTQP